MSNNKVIGDRIKQLRRMKGITQKELATNLCLTESSIKKYETGVIDIPMSRLHAIAAYFNIDVNHIIGNSELSIDVVNMNNQVGFNTSYISPIQNLILTIDSITVRSTIGCNKEKLNLLELEVIDLIKNRLNEYKYTE